MNFLAQYIVRERVKMKERDSERTEMIRVYQW